MAVLGQVANNKRESVSAVPVKEECPPPAPSLIESERPEAGVSELKRPEQNGNGTVDVAQHSTLEEAVPAEAERAGLKEDPVPEKEKEPLKAVEQPAVVPQQNGNHSPSEAGTQGKESPKGKQHAEYLAKKEEEFRKFLGTLPSLFPSFKTHCKFREHIELCRTYSTHGWTVLRTDD